MNKFNAYSTPVAPAQFSPISMQEMSVVPLLKYQEHQKAMEEAGNYKTDADVYKNDYAKFQEDKLKMDTEIDGFLDLLNTGGVDMARREASKLRKTYNSYMTNTVAPLLATKANIAKFQEEASKLKDWPEHVKQNYIQSTVGNYTSYGDNNKITSFTGSPTIGEGIASMNDVLKGIAADVKVSDHQILMSSDTLRGLGQEYVTIGGVLMSGEVRPESEEYAKLEAVLIGQIMQDPVLVSKLHTLDKYGGYNYFTDNKGNPISPYVVKKDQNGVEYKALNPESDLSQIVHNYAFGKAHTEYSVTAKDLGSGNDLAKSGTPQDIGNKITYEQNPDIKPGDETLKSTSGIVYNALSGQAESAMYAAQSQYATYAEQIGVKISDTGFIEYKDANTGETLKAQESVLIAGIQDGSLASNTEPVFTEKSPYTKEDWEAAKIIYDKNPAGFTGLAMRGVQAAEAGQLNTYNDGHIDEYMGYLKESDFSNIPGISKFDLILPGDTANRMTEAFPNAMKKYDLRNPDNLAKFLKNPQKFYDGAKEAFSEEDSTMWGYYGSTIMKKIQDNVGQAPSLRQATSDLISKRIGDSVKLVGLNSFAYLDPSFFITDNASKLSGVQREQVKLRNLIIKNPGGVALVGGSEGNANTLNNSEYEDVRKAMQSNPESVIIGVGMGPQGTSLMVKVPKVDNDGYHVLEVDLANSGNDIQNAYGLFDAQFSEAVQYSDDIALKNDYALKKHLTNNVPDREFYNYYMLGFAQYAASPNQKERYKVYDRGKEGIHTIAFKKTSDGTPMITYTVVKNGQTVFQGSGMNMYDLGLNLITNGLW